MSEGMSKINQQLEQLSPEQKEQILESFSQFKGYLKEQLAKGERLGLSDDMLAKGAKFVADYLAETEQPQNREEKVLQELWKVADESEKKSLAHVLVKMVQAD